MICKIAFQTGEAFRLTNPRWPEIAGGQPTGLHTQKAYTHTGISSPQILMLSAHAYTCMDFL